jgi:dihydropteroate synthase
MHPVTFASIQSHLEALPPPAQYNYLPLRSGHLVIDTARHTKPTLIMAVLNLTPDSFSDGGLHSPEPTMVVDQVRQMVDHGAHIIDIGGQSTRPFAKEISVEEEIGRIIPAIKAIRQSGLTVPISVDTFYSQVAKLAIEQGADIINDVSAGVMDSNMFAVAAELDVPIILMHMRGTPETMNSHAHYDGDLIKILGKELFARVEEAIRSGIRRWNIILDPGIGFAKIGEQNLEILRRLGELRRQPGLGGMAWLLGPSRKRFIGRITGENIARERTWGTAAAVAACVQGGADIVRVHDVEEMKKVVTICDAIWRSNVQELNAVQAD